MALFLYKEAVKHSNSPFYPYLALLPHSLKNFPIFYGKEELERLKNSRFERQLLERYKAYQKEYQTIKVII